MTPEADEVETASATLHSLKAEVDALQVAVMGQRTPWYRNTSTLISVLALLFSFGTTFVSYTRTKAQDIQNARIELRGLLQRLSVLPRDNFELTKKYSDDPGAVSQLSSYLNQENALLARQAAEMALRIPRDYVSATEYYAVAVALQAAYNNERANEFLRLAIDSSKDFSDKIAALRAHANLLFVVGQLEAGRAEYGKALKIFEVYPAYNEYTRNSTNVWTELAWAYAEAGAGSSESAMRHIADAEKDAAALPPSPGAAQLKGQIAQAKSVLTSPYGLPVPSSSFTAPSSPPPADAKR